jgi:uncharacterized protein YndB with AHSA1/START domain
MTALPPVHASVVVGAEPAVVFEYFVDPLRIVRWMGSEATLETEPGGTFALTVEGSAVRGRFVEVDRPHRVVFSWGFEGSTALPPASSVVEVTLTPDPDGTRVDLVHRGLSEEEAGRHGVGWRHFLSRLAPAVSPGQGVDDGS